ncbi:MAG: stage III sporulation protein AA, partial [Lachnospiraceae bacterium]
MRTGIQHIALLQNQRKKEQVLQVLAATIRETIERKSIDFMYLQEIRLRIQQPLVMIYKGKEYLPLLLNTSRHIVSKEEVQETLEYISNYSLYAYEYEMCQGYITIEGGHRVGL